MMTSFYPTFPGPRERVPHISPCFGEMWEISRTSIGNGNRATREKVRQK
jgi:hypothetical protein